MRWIPLQGHDQWVRHLELNVRQHLLLVQHFEQVLLSFVP